MYPQVIQFETRMMEHERRAKTAARNALPARRRGVLARILRRPVHVPACSC